MVVNNSRVIPMTPDNSRVRPMMKDEELERLINEMYYKARDYTVIAQPREMKNKSVLKEVIELFRSKEKDNV